MSRLLILALLIAFVSCRTTKNLPPSSLFSYLNGTFTERKGQESYHETWFVSKDGSLIGSGRQVSQGRESEEDISIKLLNGKYYYIVLFADNQTGKYQETKFTIGQITDTSFVAINRENEFPKRITYILKSRDYLLAKIDDGKDPPESQRDYHLIRQLN